MLNVIEPTSEMAVVVVGAGTVGLAAIVSLMPFQCAFPQCSSLSMLVYFTPQRPPLSQRM